MTTEPINEFHLAAWRAFLNAHVAVIGCIESELSEEGLISLGWYDVLVALTQAPEKRLPLGELARRVVLSPSGMTRLIDRLEAEGMLARERHVTDRRSSYAVLTDKGREAVRAAWPIYAHGIRRHFTDLLDDDEVRTLSTALSRISDAARSKGR